MEDKALALILDKLESMSKDIRSLKEEMDDLKSEVQSLKTEQRVIQAELKKVNITLENQIIPMFDEEREVYKTTFKRYSSNSKKIAVFFEDELPALQLAISSNSKEIARIRQSIQ